MSNIAGQVHGKFKMFVGSLAEDGSIGELAGAVAAFASDNQVAAKSIGIEYVDSVKKLVVTLGYRDDEESYPIRLHCVALGNVDMLSGDFTQLESAMTAAGKNFPNIICHELYVTEPDSFQMVIMTNEG